MMNPDDRIKEGYHENRICSRDTYILGISPSILVYEDTLKQNERRALGHRSVHDGGLLPPATTSELFTPV